MMRTFKLTQFVPEIAPFIAYNSIVIIDTGVEDWPSLAAGVLAGTEVVVLHPQEDGVAQITEFLANRRNIQALHIVSHGEPGCLYLGSTRLATETLDNYSDRLQQWKPCNPKSAAETSLSSV